MFVFCNKVALLKLLLVKLKTYVEITCEGQTFRLPRGRTQASDAMTHCLSSGINILAGVAPFP